MKEPGFRLFLFSFLAYFATNVAYQFYWDRKPMTFDLLSGSAITGIVFTAVTWVLKYRKYAKAEVNS